MPDWEERITISSRPGLRLEHVVRYRAAAPIVLGSDVWCDLGCGTGTASSVALEGFTGRAVLVDADAESVSTAATTVQASSVTELVADLASHEGLLAVERLVEPAEHACFTCFEVLEHLSPFAPLVEWLVRLAAERGHTAVLSVPNDAFQSIENPYHHTTWGDGAFAELTTLLPEDHVVATQIVLSGSCIAPTGSRVTAETELPRSQVPSHFIVAFGSRAGELGHAVELTAVDLDASRTWERQREADLAYYQTLAARAET